MNVGRTLSSAGRAALRAGAVAAMAATGRQLRERARRAERAQRRRNWGKGLLAVAVVAAAGALIRQQMS